MSTPISTPSTVMPPSVTLTVHMQPGLSDAELARLGMLAAQREMKPEEFILDIVRRAAAEPVQLAG